jgi:hypothetical protein
MEQWAIREATIRRIPRHAGRQLTPAERLGVVVVAIVGLTGVLGTLVTAWYLLLS